MKSIRNFDVNLYGERIGQLALGSRFSRFEMDEEYISSEDRRVLGLRFEEDLSKPATGQDELPAWFSNLLPEGALRAMIASAIGEFESGLELESSMLARLGRDLPGAVTIVESPYASAGPHEPDLPDTSAEAGAESNGMRFSMAGVGLKFSVLRDGERFTAPGSGFGGNWIVKMPDRTFPLLPRNEFATMQLAAKCGIEVPNITLVHRDMIVDVPDFAWAGEEYAYAIERFDRSEAGLVHIEDLAQVRGYYPRQKYMGTFATVGNLFYRGVDEASLLEFVRRLSFNMAIGNDDAHLKNWSLIYKDQRKPSISPAYDIVSVQAYVGTGLEHDTGLRFGRSKRYSEVTRESFHDLGRKLRFNDPAKLVEVAVETIGAVEANWAEYSEAFVSAPSQYSGVNSHWGSMSRQLLN